MSTQIKKPESGSAGKPGESTVVAEKSLTASGVADLLKSEFAADDDEPAGQEVQPKGKKVSDEDEEVNEGDAAAEEAAEADAGEAGEAGEEPAEGAESGEGEEHAEAEAEDEGDEGAEAEEGAAKLSEAEQAALDQWKEAGGGELPPELQKLVSKRIGKLAAARDAEKARADGEKTRADELAREVEALKADPNRPASGPAVSVPDEAGLAKLEQTAKGFLNDAENFLDDSATPEERQRVERYMQKEGLDEKGLKRRIREVNTFLTTDLPQQKQTVTQFKAAEQTATAESKKWFGRLDVKDSPEAKLAEQVEKLVPEIKLRTPSHHFARGTYVLGLNVINHLRAAGVEPSDAFAALDKALKATYPAKAGAKATATATAPGKVIPKKSPPRTPAAGSAAPAARGQRVAPDEAVRQKFTKSPTRENAVDLARAALRG